MERFGLWWYGAPRPPLPASTKIRFRSGGEFGLRLPSDPSLAPPQQHLAVFPFLDGREGVSSGTLAFTYMFPAPRAMAGLAPASRLTCRSHPRPTHRWSAGHDSAHKWLEAVWDALCTSYAASGLRPFATTDARTRPRLSLLIAFALLSMARSARTDGLPWGTRTPLRTSVIVPPSS